MQCLLDPKHSNVDNLDKGRCEASRQHMKNRGNNWKVKS